MGSRAHPALLQNTQNEHYAPHKCAASYRTAKDTTHHTDAQQTNKCTPHKCTTNYEFYTQRYAQQRVHHTNAHRRLEWAAA
eukprot:5985006-Amphidinium_carterae.1